MLDFDKCSKVDLESKDPATEVVKKYLIAVTGNDPYFPHPGLDANLWRTFRKAYLKASDIIIKTTQLKRQLGRLPAMLMDEWEQWADRDVQAEEEFDPFGRDSQDEDEEGEGEETEREDDGTDEDESSEEEDEGEYSSKDS
ncbi:hypothetical protein A1O3_01723 [Capronia epimyces CBS 606.96]|uniref:DUF3669 domain-containing protein n=1 Tax=Capronia epimyces CBS 606.96 TaxID=1182542 RepID=W9YV73_9EURO|nr:uncharacterized protein A1O3_01723 [Capronia epimyces CBS 606.96]EXJ93166.1 hypothetical protein A1O3_01723 [Capronia epimyces CBS 606.96]